MNDILNAYPETDMFGREIEGGKWGVAKRPGDDWVIEPRFDWADDFESGFARIRYRWQNGQVV